MVSGFTKWLGFVTAIWVQAIAGNNYTFANYSDALKSLMLLSQLQLNNLSVAKDVGKAFGLISGLASNHLPTFVILIIGAVESMIGYGVQWLVVSQRIRPLPYWQMCIFLGMGGNSSTWMNTAVLVTCMRNFKTIQGPVSGILKGYVGLSTAIFTDLSAALFSSDPSTFLLTLAVIPTAICLIAAIFLREMPPADTTTVADEKQQPLIFNLFNAIAIVLALYLLAFDLSGNRNHLISSIFAVGLLILLAAPLIVPFYFFLFFAKHDSLTEPLLIFPNDQLPASTAPKFAQLVPDFAGEEEREVAPVIGEDHTIFQALQTFEFWVLFISFLCGVGTGMCVMNNLGQMGQALGYKDVSIFVSLTSIWGFFGRIISGLASEYYIGKNGTPRPVWNAASQVLMVIGYIAMSVAFPGSLYIGSIMVGICYGVRLAVTVPIASELFGLKYYGLLYNILILNLPLGSFLFSGLLAGYIYDAEAARGGSSTCMGPHCYRLVFIIMAVACVVGFGLDMLLATRTRKLYGKIYEDKKLKTMLGNSNRCML